MVLIGLIALAAPSSVIVIGTGFDAISMVRVQSVLTKHHVYCACDEATLSVVATGDRSAILKILSKEAPVAEFDLDVAGDGASDGRSFGFGTIVGSCMPSAVTFKPLS